MVRRARMQKTKYVACGFPLSVEIFFNMAGAKAGFKFPDAFFHHCYANHWHAEYS
jgi:hypothetical protein